MSSSSKTDARGPVTFTTTLTGFGNNTGIVVPDEVVSALQAGSRPAVIVSVNGYEYRNTVGVMAGKHLISVSAAVRKTTGLGAGDPITVTIAVADSPRNVELPEDFLDALNKQPVSKTFFDALSNSVQRYHVDNINAAKTSETRERRIVKAIELFLAGRQR